MFINDLFQVKMVMNIDKVQAIIQQSELELKSVEVEKEIPIDNDIGNLLASDTNEIDNTRFG